MSDDPGSQALTIILPGEITGEDDYGKPIYGPDQEIPITGCSIQPLLGQASMEQMASTQDTISTMWRFFTPPTVTVDGVETSVLDVVSASVKARCSIVAGDLQVDGDPVMWPNEDGNPDHTEGYLRKWTG